MKSLLYFAVDLPLKIEKISDNPDEDVMHYLKKLEEKKDRYMYDILKIFNVEVSREELQNVMGDDMT
jgi:hypothetical protein